MDNYNEFIELLKTFNREGREEATEDDYLSFNEYNGFPCENLNDVSAYSKHMDSIYLKALSDIKKGVDKLMVERDNIHMLDIFFKGKLDDFNEINKIIEQRDEENESNRIDYRIAIGNRCYNGVELDDLGVQLYSEFERATRGEELYYRGSIDMEDLAKDCLPLSERYAGCNFFHIVAEKEQRDMVKKAKHKLEELHNLYCPSKKDGENSKVAKTNSKQVIDFRSYLHHENKDALMEKLHEILDGRKGRFIAITLKALECMKILPYLEENRAVVYKAMRNEFGYIGRNQSLDPVLKKLKGKDSTSNIDLEYIPELRQQISILEDIK